MKTSQHSTLHPSAPFNAVSWFFGILFIEVGIINMFWGNDPGFGVFIVLLAFIYFPPITVILKNKTGLTIHPLMKILTGIFITWAALGVGELFDKVHLMMSGL